MTQESLVNLGRRVTAHSLYSPAGERKYINADERTRFLDAAASFDMPTRSLCMTLVYTGCRLSEALDLTRASIQPQSNVISIRSLKKRRTGVVREVPVPDCLIDAIDQGQGLSSTRFDHIANFYGVPLWSWRRTWAWTRVKIVMNRASITGTQATPKGLRHGFGVHAVQSGVPLNLVQKWLGHAQMSTTAIYADVIGPEELAIARRMWP